jgi:hypothetical protein
MKYLACSKIFALIALRKVRLDESEGVFNRLFERVARSRDAA